MFFGTPCIFRVPYSARESDSINGVSLEIKANDRVTRKQNDVCSILIIIYFYTPQWTRCATMLYGELMEEENSGPLLN